MIVYRVKYETQHDLGGWLSMVTYERTRKRAEKFRNEVVRENSRALAADPDDPFVPEDALSPTIDRIEISTKQCLLDELTLAALSGQP